MKVVVSTYFDFNYYRWAPLLVRSLLINEPDIAIYLHGVNLKDWQCKELSSFPNVKGITLCKIAHDEKISKEFAWQMIERKASFFRKSFKRFPDADMYILIDVDTLVVNPLKELIERMKDYDMAGVQTGPQKIMGGFLVAKNEPVVKEYWKELDEFLMGDGDFYYNKDQPAIFHLYEKYKERIRFLPLSWEYLDIWSRETADIFIWSAHKTEYGDKDQRYKLYKDKIGRMA